MIIDLKTECSHETSTLETKFISLINDKVNENEIRFKPVWARKHKCRDKNSSSACNNTAM